MDRERLKEVKQTDITESRVNEEFVDWLKNKAPSWLLAILLAACGYLAIVKWRQSEDAHAIEAWAAIGEARLPITYEQIADQYGDVDSLALLGRLRSGQRLLNAVQIATPLDAEPGQSSGLTEETRQSYLARADTQFEQILGLIGEQNELDSVLFAVSALDGRAAVAEARGDAETARSYYEQSAARCETFYPELAAQARIRAANVGEVADAASLPSDADLTPPTAPAANLKPVVCEAPLTDLLLPPDDADN
ncbi:MAG: hypothetical protein ACYTGG_13680 [Planctomycetota bacterium]|jgi:hypothetical protein